MNADASTAEFEGTLDHRWIAQLGVLDVLLRAEGFYISPDRWVNIADLLTNLMLQNGIGKNEDYHLNVKQYLSPLICKSAREQQEFSRVFAGWWQDIYPSESDSAPTVPQILHEKANRFSNSVLAFLFLLVIMAISALVYFYSPEPMPVKSTAVEATKEVPEVTTVKGKVDHKTSYSTEIQPLVEENIPSLFSLNDTQKSQLAFSQLVLVSVLPLFILLVLLIGSFRPMLRKSKADRDNPLRFLKLQFANDNLFDSPKLRAALRSLHVPHSILTKRLHPKRTVYACLHHGGLYTPVYATRTEVPDIMVWVNNKGKLDPVQAIADTLVQRLRAADLSVNLYSYRNRPDRLLDRTTGQWVSGCKVQALHPGARLILVTSSQTLIDLMSQKALLWVNELAKQFDTVVLEPGAQHSANIEQLKAANIKCCALSSEGIRQVCASFSQTPQAIDTQRLAFFPQYLNQADRWRSPVTPNKKDRNLLLSVLHSYLGQSGYTLLCASAAYPEFRWGLVRALDISLFSKDDAITREIRLLSLSQLPWARDGWLPEWLRLGLMRSQDKNQRDTVRMLYQQLLVEIEVHGEEGIKLPVHIHKLENNLHSYLRQWFKRSKPNSDLEDSVFVELMLGGRFRRLDFELPRALGKILPVSSMLRRIISTLLVVGFAALAAWGVNSLANYYSLQQKAQDAWLKSITPDESLNIQIYYNSKSELLAKQLQAVMSSLDDGNNQSIIDLDLGKDNSFRKKIARNSLLQENQYLQSNGLIIYQAGFQPQAQWLADRVAYASNALPPMKLDVSQFPELKANPENISLLKRVHLELWLPKGSAESNALEGHTERVYHAAYSPDGKRIVTASMDKTARVWDSASGMLLHILKGHGEGVYQASFSPDGARIVTASFDNTARVWDSASGTVLHTLEGHALWVNYAAFSPDGTRIVTASYDKTAGVWDSASGTLLHILEGHTGEVDQAAFSPNGARIVTASRDKTVRVWDSASGTLLHILEGHTGDVYQASFSPDGARIVTASLDNTARVWDSASGTVLHILEGHSGGVYQASFSPDGSRIVTASEDKAARVWDSASGMLLLILEGHTGEVNHAAFSSDGTRIVTASRDKTARLWDSASGTLLHIFKGHTGDVYQASFSPDGARIVTASRDKTARVWNGQVETAKNEVTKKPEVLVEKIIKVQSVSSVGGWISTGIEVQLNDSIEITYKAGCWTGNRNQPKTDPCHGPDGPPRDVYPGGSNYPVPGVTENTLVGRIGNDRFYVGNHLIKQVSAVGQLMLAMNDTGYRDNEGEIIVLIQVTPNQLLPNNKD